VRLTPGIRIVNVPPPLDDGLPVMDVPVFVGFAEHGPLDRPVALEDPGQYLAVFGGPLDLVARPVVGHDSLAAGPMLRAHLPAAVASFFAGGGRRCYVIRVAADAGDAFFPVAGLRLATRTERGDSWQLAASDFQLRTASPGAWADRHQLAARIRSEMLHADDLLRVGDVLRASHPADPARIGWLRVDAGGVLDTVLMTASTNDWIWTAADFLPSAVAASPHAPVGSAEWLIERVRLDLALRHPQQVEIRREACGLSAGADNLPWFEADAAGRFDNGEALPAADWPLAGRSADELAPGNWMLLPKAIGPFFEHWQSPLDDGRDTLSRNGLARYDAGLFTDHAWNERLRDAGLLRWADEIRYFSTSPRRLTGLHGALGRDDAVSRDATWIAVPDAVHPGWKRTQLPARHDGTLNATPDEPCTCTPPTAFDACQPPPPRIPQPPRFNLDALCSGENTAAIAPADTEWSILASDPESGPALSFEVQIALRPDFSDAMALRVVAENPDDSVQWTPGPGQSGCVQKPVKPGPRHFAPVQYRLRLTPGLHYLRARSWRAGRYSDWSETVEVLARSTGWILREERPEQPARDAIAYVVHSALLDFCAATREHFALLAVPEHWDSARLARHTAALRQHADDGFETAHASSFGALHHPWLVRREAASAATTSGADKGELHAHPPEGAVLGMYARRSRQKGAWAAAGLEPLAEAFALSSAIDAGMIEAAFANAIEQRPAGIAATRAATLSGDPDWESIGVRRLFILLRRLARREGERYVFEPNDLTLRRSLEHSFEAQLRRLMQRGAFRGASAAESYLLRTASGQRANEEIERGECSMEIRVAPSRPLRFLTLRVLRAGEQLLIEES